MTLLMKKRVLAIKKEAALGTGIATTNTEGYLPAFDIRYTPNLQMIDRASPGSASMFASVVGSRSGSVSFKTYLYCGGSTSTAPSWAELLFPACGYTQTGEAFSPATVAPAVSVTAPTTVTVSSYEDGLQKTISGAMGTWKMTFTSGELIVIDWTFTGIYEGVAAAAPVVANTLLTPTYDTTIPLRFAASVFTIGVAGGPTCVNNLTIDAGNDVLVRPCATSSTGFIHSIIPTRKVTGTINPESALLGTEDVHALWLAGTEEAFSCKVADATDRCTITMPKFQRTNIQPGERNGIQTDEITFQANKSAAAGDDEIAITFAAA